MKDAGTRRGEYEITGWPLYKSPIATKTISFLVKVIIFYPVQIHEHLICSFSQIGSNITIIWLSMLLLMLWLVTPEQEASGFNHEVVA